MHTITTHKFDLEREAQHFAQQHRQSIVPGEDKYVLGPYWMDNEQILRGHSWNRSTAKWWQVTIEQFR